MASINGLIGFAGKAAYNSAKHGVIGLTKVAALEGAAHGITVNAICPGYVNTPLVRNQLEDLAHTRQVPLEKVLEEIIYPLVPQKRLLDSQEIAYYFWPVKKQKELPVKPSLLMEDIQPSSAIIVRKSGFIQKTGQNPESALKQGCSIYDPHHLSEISDRSCY